MGKHCTLAIPIANLYGFVLLRDFFWGVGGLQLLMRHFLPFYVTSASSTNTPRIG